MNGSLFRFYSFTSASLPLRVCQWWYDRNRHFRHWWGTFPPMAPNGTYGDWRDQGFPDA